MPKWSTIPRRAKLLELYFRSGGFCVYGERPCTKPKLHHYEYYVKGLVKDWVADDREENSFMYRVIKANLHRIPERGALRGRFNFVSRDIYHDSQPQYYLEAIGLDAVKFKPFAKIRIASGYTRLHVDIDEPLKVLSKHKKRKAIRYGKGLPVDVQKQVESICNLAIARYLSK